MKVPQVFVISCVLALLPLSASSSPRLGDATYRDKVRGAWTGKCIGGALGMPLESWRAEDIREKFPDLNGYVGYFTNVPRGWSDFLAEATIPKDGAWHPVTVRFEVPAFDARDLFAAPIIGLSLERHAAPQEYELRNVRVTQPVSTVAFGPDAWVPANACAWTPEGTARATYTGERAWLKMKPEAARPLPLKAGGAVEIALEARWISGDNRLGFALDYLTREPLKGFGPDDDTSYQIVGLLALEKHGPDLSARGIGEEWVALLPEIHPSLAEGVALQRMRSGIRPPESGEHPAGEAIGGQMKGEVWGLVCPGRPDLAAEYARRDGVVAHHRNGVYGEQFVAAMVAQSFVEPDVHRLVETGLRHIPKESEYARVVRGVILDHAAGKPWREVLKDLVDRYPGICDPVFAEAGIVTLALLYGDGDFEKSILIAARCGNDTDCNTATVGALLGCIHGRKALPKRWTEPIGNDFRCFVKGHEEWRISDLSRRIAAAGRKVLEHHGEGRRFTTDL